MFQTPDLVNIAIINADECYRFAEQKAADYFESLYQQVIEKAYIPALIKDIQSWKHKHSHHNSLRSGFFCGKKKPDSRDYHRYIRWLNYTGKLDSYLDRSISYIFMRDLGKALDSPDTQAQVRREVDKLREQLIRSISSDKTVGTQTISLAELYRKAQKEGIESTFVWVIEKLKTVSANIPMGMDVEQAQRKLIKIIAGVLMHEIEEMSDMISAQERTQKLENAIRLGYSYGLTYPFIDDLLDANILSTKEKNRYSNFIRTTLITGTVPKLGEWTGKNSDLIRYIHSELKDAFAYIKANQRSEKLKAFLEQAYVFFNSQEVDYVKNLSNTKYTNEDLYIPIILKSSSARLIVRSVTNAPEDSGFDNRTFFYGIYNQLADDFADMFDDMKEGAVTPYTYYIKYHNQRSDLINPFELYWAVISNLIHNIYHSDIKTCEVILDRAINGLKRFKERFGAKKYNEIMDLFASSNTKFNDIVQKMVRKVDDVDFFDKLIRDRIITLLKNEKGEQREFEDTMNTVRKQINCILNIPVIGDIDWLSQNIVYAANYSLEADGKRVRPLIAWAMGVIGYGLDPKAMLPLLRSLEYMHTASLIFDDLPSQDNASTRRGQYTLHEKYNIATAELTALFLTQKAVEEQASLEQFDAATVLKLIRYSASVTQVMCKGQEMDLDSRGKQLTLGQLDRMCFYKTGIAFEASLVMPSILAEVEEPEIEALKKFAYHAGVAYQIKDDLLDNEGNTHLLGKPTGKDADNNNSTFVTILSAEGARKEMWNHYCEAMETLPDIPRNTTFLKQLMNYIVNRDN